MNAKDIARFGYVASNILTSVLLVIVNRELLSRRGFGYPLTLTGAHLVATGIFGRVWSGREGSYKGFRVDRHVAKLVMFSMLSLGFLNFSLMYNTISFYQASKLLIIPCSAFFEYLTMGTSLTFVQMGFVGVSLVGVAFVSVSDLHFQIHFWGICIAIFAIVFSSLQQIYTRLVQIEAHQTSAELLMVVGTLSGTLLSIIGLPIDRAMGDSQLGMNISDWEQIDVMLVALSIFLAILVNLTQYMCLGKFTVVTFQVASNMKTVSVFVSGWLIFGEIMSSVKALGCAMTICGIYGFSNAKKGA